MKFKVGDKVTFTESKLADLEVDWLSDVGDHCMSGRAFDRLSKAIENNEPFTVSAIDENGITQGVPGYEIKFGKINTGYMFEDEDLQPWTATPKL